MCTTELIVCCSSMAGEMTMLLLDRPADGRWGVPVGLWSAFCHSRTMPSAGRVNTRNGICMW